MDPSRRSREEPNAAGPIPGDLTCIHCDYNLRTLSPASLCPECGRPVSDSLRSDFLQYAPRPWLRELASGAAWIRWAPLVAVAMSLLAMLALDALQAMGIVTPHGVKSTFGVFTQAIPLAGAMLAGLIGCLRITSPEPGRGPRTQSIRTSRTARMMILAAAAVLALAVILDVMRRGQFVVLQVGAIIAWPVGYLALLTHLRELALRVPDGRLARDTRIAIIGAIVLNIFFAFWLFFLLGRYRRHLCRILHETEDDDAC